MLLIVKIVCLFESINRVGCFIHGSNPWLSKTFMHSSRWLQQYKVKTQYVHLQSIVDISIKNGSPWLAFRESVIGLCLSESVYIAYMHESDLFLRLIFNHLNFSINLQTHQSHLKEGQHPNCTSDFKDKTKLTLKNSRKAVVFGSVSVRKHVCFQTNSSLFTGLGKVIIHFRVTIDHYAREERFIYANVTSSK